MSSWTERLRSATVTAFSIKCISSKVVSAEPEYISRKGFISLFLARPAATPSQWRRYEWADSRSPPHGRKRLSYPVGGRRGGGGGRERKSQLLLQHFQPPTTKFPFCCCSQLQHIELFLLRWKRSWVNFRRILSCFFLLSFFFFQVLTLT